MATWEVKITVLDVAKKAVSIAATRTDVDNIRTYNVLYAIIDTVARKTAILDNIWLHYQQDLTKDATINTFVGNLETQAKTNLEAREI